jgi:putative solute:sodium symporter small subunit
VIAAHAVQTTFKPQRLSSHGGKRMQLTDSHRQYWQKNLRLTSVLLSIWFVVTFVIGWFARDLNFNFFGWPFSFWVASQGALIVYMLIIWYYARTMNRLDQEHNVAEVD